eukprot:6190731-Prorocentrum_lima.AAC.1
MNIAAFCLTSEDQKTLRFRKLIGISMSNTLMLNDAGDRPTRKRRFQYRRWSTMQKVAPPRMCATCSTCLDIEAGQ